MELVQANEVKKGMRGISTRKDIENRKKKVRKIVEKESEDEIGEIIDISESSSSSSSDDDE